MDKFQKEMDSSFEETDGKGSSSGKIDKGKGSSSGKSDENHPREYAVAKKPQQTKKEEVEKVRQKLEKRQNM